MSTRQSAPNNYSIPVEMFPQKLVGQKSHFHPDSNCEISMNITDQIKRFSMMMIIEKHFTNVDSG